MNDEILQTAAIVAAVWTMAILLHWLTYRQAGNARPPKPEWLREKFAKEPVTGPIAYVIVGTFLLPLLVPAVILIVLSESELGRSVGVGLAAWGAALLALGIWRGRPERRRRDQERLLAHSESFWQGRS